ncbi:MAG: HAMP domain-containing histidine kinase [Spirochaetales bacterium]|nr:HAMP domain-containing histidine kinase [Spirochaetales bacterium]
MKTLFLRTLFSFILVLLIFLIILAAFIYLGFDRSLASWSDDKLEATQSEIIRLFENPDDLTQLNISDGISVFIYGPNQELLFSNRGEGRRRSFADETDVEKVIIDGKVAGYYHIGRVAFQNDVANQRFIASISRVLWIGALTSCVVSAVYAFFFSRGLARPATVVARGIRTIASGNLSEEIPQNGVEEISQIAAAANDLRKQLLNEQRLRIQWTQDIAHDLRTPVSALKAQFEGMRDGVLPVSTERIAQNLQEIHRVETLVNDLQELMQLENPELRLEIRAVDIDVLLRTILSSFALEAEKKNITVILKPSGITLSCDENLVHRALANIAANAVRHTRRGGVMELSAEAVQTAGKSETLITVRNTGDVVPQEELHHVFDRLYRGDRARNSPGSGLGLTIARQIAELHGGTITMRSSVEEGTIVAIRLPA